ncbi:MAG: hypothetical protein J7M25_08850 [Deltaproteobacteria bacterium]|nr:hypothetical protein [Deltaproteobacteria bacterium]
MAARTGTSVIVVVAASVLLAAAGAFAGGPIRVTEARLTRPATGLTPSDATFADLAAHFKKGVALLQQGRIVLKSGKPDIIVSRLRTYRTNPDDPGVIFRVHLAKPGLGSAYAVFKPFQRSYRDGYRELAACKLARYLGVPQPACLERTFTRKEVQAGVDLVPRKYRGLLLWDGNTIHGYLRLWAFKFRRRIGRLTPSREQLLPIAAEIRAGRACDRPQICHDLSDLLVIDYLIANNDRQFNVGSILLPNHTVQLFAIDWGDGFSGGPKALRNKVWYRKAFRAVHRFHKPLVDRLRTLTVAQVDALLRDSKGRLLVKPFYVRHVVAAAKQVVARVDELHKALGARVYW